MYKKFLCFTFTLFLLTGCGVNSINESTTPKKVVETGSITCHTDDSDFELILSNGQIISYIDSVDGELGQETVDILNQEHLVGVNSDEEALRIMSVALSDLDGYCE